MLDNTELIATLDNTKVKALEVAEKLVLATETAINIDKLRDGYVLIFHLVLKIRIQLVGLKLALYFLM